MAELKIMMRCIAPTGPSCSTSTPTGVAPARCLLLCCMSAEEYDGVCKVGKVNVDEQMELAMRYQVSSIPMLVVLKDGKPVSKAVGCRSKADLLDMLKNAI